MGVVLDAERGDLPVHRLGDLALCPLDLGPFSRAEAPMMFSAPQVSMQAMGFRSEA
jgi:hypothetical protein